MYDCELDDLGLSAFLMYSAQTTLSTKLQPVVPFDMQKKVIARGSTTFNPSKVMLVDGLARKSGRHLLSAS